MIANNWTTLLEEGVEKLRSYKRSQRSINTWFYAQEIKMLEREAMLAQGINPDDAPGRADLLCRMVEKIPLTIPPGAVLAGDQDAAFSPSYALINPAFTVESFSGYCDPCAVYDDIEHDSALTPERVAGVRKYWEKTLYIRKMRGIYGQYGRFTSEAAFFMEPVTGHTIPDLRPFLRLGVDAMRQKALDSTEPYARAMARALQAPGILAGRYRLLALDMAAKTTDAAERERLLKTAKTLERAPASGATNMHEAMQSFTLLWQTMAIEQAPNPYAFSVGNLDRILEPFRNDASFEETVALIRHLLCFFQVGARCWAISQNVMVGGRDEHGADLTNPTTMAALEAFFQSNDPQPALSVKVHSNTPDAVYCNMGRFFFTPGHSTPSLFNDDSLLPMLISQGIAPADAPDYGIAGCQEPLIMGKSSCNTTNTWLNLAKALELSLNDGKSLLSGKQIAPSWRELGYNGADAAYAEAETVFFKTLDALLPEMAGAGNACSDLLGQENPVPFTSALMESFSTFRDMREPAGPGVSYSASGCLIHGLSVVTDSLTALPAALRIWPAQEIRTALANNFETNPRLKAFLESRPKYANNDDASDEVAVRLARAVSERVSALRNTAGRPFLADWSTPSTHLLYGHWVGATPDGRPARQMLGYGIDPRPEAARSELPERFLSFYKLPFHLMTGGYASHLGIKTTRHPGHSDPKAAAEWMRERVIKPLFRLGQGVQEAPYYVYFNVDNAAHLRELLREPKKHAPGGIYILRIHGTFVNFLDLSPAIQEDIIARLESGAGMA